MKKALRAAITLKLSLLGIAIADAEDGHRLYSDCAAPLTKPESSACIAYVSGVIDALLAVQDRQLSPRLICLPNGIRVGIIKDASTIDAKLYELWPCSK